MCCGTDKRRQDANGYLGPVETGVYYPVTARPAARNGGDTESRGVKTYDGEDTEN